MRLRTGSTGASSVHFRNEVLHCKCCSGVCAKRRNPKKLGAWHKRLYNFKFVATMIASELLLQGYRLGVFPMAMEDNAIEWFSPDPRAIMPLQEFHVSHALQRILRKGVFQIKIDNRFAEVIRACATRDCKRPERLRVPRDTICACQRVPPSCHESSCSSALRAQELFVGRTPPRQRHRALALQSKSYIVNALLWRAIVDLTAG